MAFRIQFASWQNSVLHFSLFRQSYSGIIFEYKSQFQMQIVYTNSLLLLTK